jgi:hypothetical protein
MIDYGEHDSFEAKGKAERISVWEALRPRARFFWHLSGRSKEDRRLIRSASHWLTTFPEQLHGVSAVKSPANWPVFTRKQS